MSTLVRSLSHELSQGEALDRIKDKFLADLSAKHPSLIHHVVEQWKETVGIVTFLALAEKEEEGEKEEKKKWGGSITVTTTTVDFVLEVPASIKATLEHLINDEGYPALAKVKEAPVASIATEPSIPLAKSAPPPPVAPAPVPPALPVPPAPPAASAPEAPKPPVTLPVQEHRHEHNHHHNFSNPPFMNSSEKSFTTAKASRFTWALLALVLLAGIVLLWARNRYVITHALVTAVQPSQPSAATIVPGSRSVHRHHRPSEEPQASGQDDGQGSGLSESQRDEVQGMVDASADHVIDQVVENDKQRDHVLVGALQGLQKQLTDLTASASQQKTSSPAPGTMPDWLQALAQSPQAPGQTRVITLSPAQQPAQQQVIVEAQPEQAPVVVYSSYPGYTTYAAYPGWYMYNGQWFQDPSIRVNINGSFGGGGRSGYYNRGYQQSSRQVQNRGYGYQGQNYQNGLNSRSLGTAPNGQSITHEYPQGQAGTRGSPAPGTGGGHSGGRR